MGQAPHPIQLAWLFAALAACGSPASTPPSPTPGLVAFTGARLITGHNDPGAVVENGTVLIQDGVITAVGPGETVEIPPDAEQHDMTGRTIMPGLINAHGHVNAVRGLESSPAFYTETHVVDQLSRYARYGVTTVFSLGGDGPAGIAVRDRPDADLDHARIFVAGPIVAPDTPEQAVEQVDIVADMGADLVKIRVDDGLGASIKMPPAVYRAVIDRAHERGLPVAAHIYYLDDAKGLLEAGVDLIAHSVRDQSVDDELVELLTSHDVCYCPTLMREVSTFVYESRPSWFDDPFFRRDVDPTVIAALEDPSAQQRVRDRPSTPVYKQALETAQQNLKRLVDGGVRIAMGTDTGPPGRFQGYFEHRELELMAEAGLSPMTVIASATGDAARCMDRDHVIGTLEPGLAADLLVLGANPLDDVGNTQAIESVWVAGNEVPGAASR